MVVHPQVPRVPHRRRTCRAGGVPLRRSPLRRPVATERQNSSRSRSINDAIKSCLVSVDVCHTQLFRSRDCHGGSTRSRRALNANRNYSLHEMSSAELGYFKLGVFCQITLSSATTFRKYAASPTYLQWPNRPSKLCRTVLRRITKDESVIPHHHHLL